MEYLVFRLYGAMVSWGDIAVGTSRHTANHPSKSAIIGLIGAALGIKREDEETQIQLSEGYGFAIKQYSTGTLLQDFHTSQTPDSVGKFQYRTRRDELVFGQERLGTVLSTREYLTDSVALVAVNILNNAPFSLQKIKDKLLKPEFHLYLGRKSCPLSIPLSPQIISEHRGFKLALDHYHWQSILPFHKKSRDEYWFSLNDLNQYYWEGNMNDFSSDESEFNSELVQTFIRHDQPRSRKRWQFSPRQENFYQQDNIREGS